MSAARWGSSFGGKTKGQGSIPWHGCMKTKATLLISAAILVVVLPALLLVGLAVKKHGKTSQNWEAQVRPNHTLLRDESYETKPQAVFYNGHMMVTPR